jgi:hypothetical protein
MNEYDIFLKQHYDRVLAERQWRKNNQFLEELAENEPAHPTRPRFHLHLPRFRRFHLERFTRPCGNTQLDSQ